MQAIVCISDLNTSISFAILCNLNRVLVVAHWAHFLGGSQMYTDVLLIENSYRLM